MTIKQINASYFLNEDRILFRFNTSKDAEYRLWFTRRVTLFILAASSHLFTKKLENSHSPDVAKVIQQFENEAISEAVKSSNEEAQTYQAGTQFPIGFDPLLVMDISCSLEKNSDILSMDFLLAGGANLNLKIPENMLRATCLLLDQLRQQAGWGEALLTVKNEQAEEAGAEQNITQKVSLH